MKTLTVDDQKRIRIPDAKPRQIFAYCDCSVIYAVESDSLFNRRGRVSLERRGAIRAKVRDLFRLGATD